MSRSPLARRDPRTLLALRRALAVLLTLLTAITGPASLALAQEAQQEAPAAAATAVKQPDENVFVIYRDETTGETACREATPAEKLELDRGGDAGPTNVIYEGGERLFAPDGGGVKGARANLTTETGLALQPSVGLRIVLHGTTQLQNNPAARDAFIVAANRWEARISTQMTVVLDADFGPTIFGDDFDPGVLGATFTSETSRRFSTVRQQLLAASPGAEETTLFNALPDSSVPVELNGTSASTRSIRLASTVARAIGVIPDITNPDGLPIGQGDAGIGFNSAFNFDFNPNDGISPGALDFDAVVVHEIGHALGFVSESGNNAIGPLTLLDLFRFRPGAASVGALATAPRVMSLGGQQVFFSNRTS
ncbi:MAG TPA: NF038122 family metalloprotease, partial [Pyrinomonadaceae bacterium]|nr:NF038122 family metalloprotease [Pyrinomonadaceae bacterium]